MLTRIKIYTAILFTAFLSVQPVMSGKSKPADEKKMLVYVFELNQGIDPAAWRIVKKAVEEAEAMHADYIIMRLNTYGGMVDFADSIRTKLLNAKPITIVFIDHNAASAGALISIACDSIYMRRGSSIGAASVVSSGGELVPEKFQSYMRSIMRSTAETQGRNPKIAETMVTPGKAIPDIVDSGKIITFTTSEAIKNGFCEGEAENINEVLHLAGIKDYTIEKQRTTSLDKLIGLLLSPVVSGLLLMIVFGGIYFELQTPGIGFPILAAITAAILYFAPLYLEGLAANWEILIFILGLILIALEIFIFPGHGIWLIMGIMMMFIGLTLSLVSNDVFDFSLTSTDGLNKAMLTVLSSFIGSIILIIIFGKNLLQSPLFQKMILQDTQQSEEGFSIRTFDKKVLLNKSGVAVTLLRPSGKVEIENERYDASTQGEFIEKGEAVIVSEVKNNYLLVRKA